MTAYATKQILSRHEDKPVVYEIENDTYMHPNGRVLDNLLDIRTPDNLAQVESDISAVEIAIMEEHPVKGKFDLAHLQAMHKQIFGTIYPWAGQLRTVNMAKDSTVFAPAEYLSQAGATLFSELASVKHLRGFDEGEFLEHFAHYYSEVNILHPFREGNGRTQRAFFTLLARYNGYYIDWDLMHQDDNISASIAAYKGDEEPLREILYPLLDWVGLEYWQAIP